ncbi:hypothetical protein V500_11118 [Pseudogymnoascus sp. VKM F-4518 (FW-2643)]|nr:hypothetical protein V500_11118 [Pseudogymnoascus sp. VKM F-4518 (FW-2643)]
MFLNFPFFLAVLGAPDVHAAKAPTAKTKNGTYVGLAVPQLSQDIFRGIPFARAPRFELAQSLNSSWSGTHEAVELGLTCSGYGTNNLLGLEVGEDCLNLNVVRPSGTKSKAKLPVLVWIYGGGFRQGSVNDREFNTSYMVETSVQIGKPVIIVSINYRLSAFGFLFSKEVQSQGATNLGIRDQWKALEWINENIGGFGGDPKQVTVWGESAGAFSIGWLTVAYGGQNSNLFQRAIMVSGSSFGIGSGNPVTAQSTYNALTNDTGCNQAIDSLQCLRELPFETLNKTITDLPAGLATFLPTLDGDIIRNSPSFAYAQNPPLIAPVDIITGCNTDEGMSEALSAQTPFNTSAEVENYLTAGLGVDTTVANEILALYPEDGQYPPYSQPMSLDWPALTAALGIQSGTQTRRVYGIINDFAMMAGRRLTASSWTPLTGKKAYSFRWDVDPSRIPLVYTPGLGVGFAEHGAELSFEFRLPYVSGSPYPPIPDVPAMRNVSYAMQAHFVAFAATGDPNSHHVEWIPKWPVYAGSTQNFVQNWRIVLISRTEQKLQAYAAETAELYPSAPPVLTRTADASDPSSLLSALDWAASQLDGKVDVLCYKAAVVGATDLMSLTPEVLTADFKITAVGLLVTGQWFPKHANKDHISAGEYPLFLVTGRSIG